MLSWFRVDSGLILKEKDKLYALRDIWSREVSIDLRLVLGGVTLRNERRGMMYIIIVKNCIL